MSNARKQTPEQENAGAVKFLAHRKKLEKTGTAKVPTTKVDAGSKLTAEEVELPESKSLKTAPATDSSRKASSKTAKPKTSNRHELPKRDFSQRVRSDIHERLHDEHYLRRKDGEQARIGDIADEALHLGLLQLERRRK